MIVELFEKLRKFFHKKESKSETRIFRTTRIRASLEPGIRKLVGSDIDLFDEDDWYEITRLAELDEYARLKRRVLEIASRRRREKEI